MALFAPRMLLSFTLSAAALSSVRAAPSPTPMANESADDLYRRGRDLHRRDPAAALALYERAAALGHVAATKQAGVTEIRLGHNAAAIAWFEKYLALHPTARDASTVRDIIKKLRETP